MLKQKGTVFRQYERFSVMFPNFGSVLFQIDMSAQRHLVISHFKQFLRTI